ncbi:hypothetical protein BD289DRAFT_251119 [Coniella lustricola]|uniref:Uncharacterized protein n=1 Tax=Coniella lustricola TaxID=2025994 RepID=A0A2T3A8M5_9PEZI|nr:hypothetical protein BD289DRAFT_251119 [Coniella lustricola]
MAFLAKAKTTPSSTMTHRGITTSIDDTARRLPTWTHTISRLAPLPATIRPGGQASAKEKRSKVVRERYEQLEKRARPQAMAAIHRNRDSNNSNNNLMMWNIGFRGRPRTVEPSTLNVARRPMCTPHTLCELSGSCPALISSIFTVNTTCRTLCELPGSFPVVDLPQEMDATPQNNCELP